ncbi:MAG: MBOAT family O-acyltransferase [Hyphomicrobiaceae bacterium]
MIYSNYDFLALLPALLLWFYLARTVRTQNIVLLLVSLGFIAWAGVWNLIILAAVTAVVWIYLKLDEHFQLSRPWLGLVIGLLILNLAYFKYRDFLSQSLGISLPAPSLIAWIVPLGISFYTFEAVSATLDLKDRKKVPPLREWSLFMTFFPHLIAGPVVRYRQLAPQFNELKSFNWRHISVGLHLFTLGFVKKLAADPIGRIIDPVWAAPSQASSLALFLALLGFYAQIYADFSGYTDMGRGVARMMGYRLPINFRAPYFAASPGEFFQRWHISLSSWIRTFIFVKLSFAVLSRIRSRRWQYYAQIGVTLVVMAIFGLWHGAAWHFVLCGVWLGVMIAGWTIVTKGKAPRTRWGLVLSIVLLQVCWLVALILFRAENMSAVGAYVWGLFAMRSAPPYPGLWWCLVAVAVVMLSQAVDYCVWRRPVARAFVAMRATTGGAVLMALVFVAALSLKIAGDNGHFAALSTGQPGLPSVGFIYFQF